MDVLGLREEEPQLFMALDPLAAVSRLAPVRSDSVPGVLGFRV